MKTFEITFMYMRLVALPSFVRREPQINRLARVLGIRMFHQFLNWKNMQVLNALAQFETDGLLTSPGRYRIELQYTSIFKPATWNTTLYKLPLIDL